MTCIPACSAPAVKISASVSDVARICTVEGMFDMVFSFLFVPLTFKCFSVHENRDVFLRFVFRKVVL